MPQRVLTPLGFRIKKSPVQPMSWRARITAVFSDSPARGALLIFLLITLFFAVLLTMPFSSADGTITPFHDSLFVATSAVSVTGLSTVNTADHWSFLGQIILLCGVQVGGLGILTVATMLTMSVSKQLGLKQKLIAQEGMTTGRLGETGALIRVVITTTLVIEALIMLAMTPRFIALEKDFWLGLWHGLFYAVSAFNNAGFLSHTNGLADFGNDAYISTVIAIAVMIGGLGFPVIMVLLKYRWDLRRWNLHTRMTVEVTLILFVLGALAYGFFEWSNPATMGDKPLIEKIGLSLFASTAARSSGFNIVDINEQLPQTLLLTDALMFVGGGAASTAGGIKVTTFAVIVLAIVAEARGSQDATAYHRRLPQGAIRVAVAVLALGSTMVLVGTLALTTISGETLQRPLFEAISAFGTCGLSTGFSAELPPSGKYVLTALMFFGRLGTITFASALAMRQRRTMYRYPEERPIIG
ncbi:TrkH family potassium uptake protein [Micrococcoides hystricis]|uniref:TrkH family potassium uptake protein n=1 Tax=Micrococcoides hystricis TaxID=1572761 RepID=A0ABV6PD65_9MICC